MKRNDVLGGVETILYYENCGCPFEWVLYQKFAWKFRRDSL